MIGLVEAPSHRDIAADIVQDRRQATEIQLLAQVLDIQPKDVPILALAYRHADREPTILTNDEAFAACVPAEHNLPTITIEHVTWFFHTGQGRRYRTVETVAGTRIH